MKFLLDAHLPPSLRQVFAAAGHDALHTLDLPAQNKTRDGILNQVSVDEKRVVVTKDTDFYYSHLLHTRPWKLVLVRTGNLGLKDTRAMFASHLPEIIQALSSCTVVEINQKTVSIIA
jgi:predicted nuclease of predicted toxin-antitoxin system